MKFKVGDRVKFLNEPGGGIVSKIISSTLVNVMIEDGFEIPTLTGDLLKMESTEKAASMFEESVGPAGGLAERTGEMAGKDAGEDDLGRCSYLGNYSFRTRNQPGVYLAMVPQNQKWLVTGPVEVYVVNHTPYDLIFSLLLKDEDGYGGVDYDVVPPGSKILLETAEREKLVAWQEGILQCLFHSGTPRKVLMPASSSFKIPTSRLVSENAYVETEFIEERTLIVPAVFLSDIDSVKGTELMDKEKVEKPVQTRSEPVKPGALIDKYRTSPHEAVVDLHIEELEDAPGNLEGRAILDYQLRFFERCVESAIAGNYHKVTFIHGVGNGVLKSALIKRLQDYENLENHIASLAKFGVGAIDVVIRPMK